MSQGGVMDGDELSSPEERAIIARGKEYIRELVARSNLPKGSNPSRVRRAEAIGNFWRKIREEQGKNRSEIAEALGISRNQLIFFEQGIIPLEDLPERFVINLTHVLERPDALLEHVSRFELLKIMEKRRRKKKKKD